MRLSFSHRRRRLVIVIIHVIIVVIVGRQLLRRLHHEVGITKSTRPEARHGRNGSNFVRIYIPANGGYEELQRICMHLRRRYKGIRLQSADCVIKSTWPEENTEGTGQGPFVSIVPAVAATTCRTPSTLENTCDNIPHGMNSHGRGCLQTWGGAHTTKMPAVPITYLGYSEDTCYGIRALALFLPFDTPNHLMRSWLYTSHIFM